MNTNGHSSKSVVDNIIKLYENQLKSVSHYSPQNCFIYFNEIPLKIMKNAFYFTLKALFFSRYLIFLLHFSVM